MVTKELVHANKGFIDRLHQEREYSVEPRVLQNAESKLLWNYPTDHLYLWGLKKYRFTSSFLYEIVFGSKPFWSQTNCRNKSAIVENYFIFVTKR
jgi:hypothetical protein